MSEWERHTPWKQGSILSAEDAVSLGILSEGDNNCVLVAISHDCDIVNDNLRVEPSVEFLVGAKIPRLDGNFTRAKNARVLHLEFDTPAGKQAVAFSIRERREVPKTLLAEIEPRADWKHSTPKGLICLRWWLAARYIRASFPDTFENRLARAKLGEKIDKLLGPYGENIFGIFFLVDDGQGESLLATQPHELRAAIVYDAEAPEEQIAAIQKVAVAVTEAFKSKLFDARSRAWKDIELVSCDAFSDEAFSFAASRYFKQWRLEYRSLEDDSQQPPVENA